MSRQILLLAAIALSVAATAPAAEKPASYQNTPVFPVNVTQANAADIQDILLQYYNPVEGRWVGCGLFQISHPQQGEVRARINFTAPEEGVFRLRSVARDPAGNIETVSDDPQDCHIVAVYDATPPAVELVFPRGGEKIEVPGTVNIKWTAHDRNIARKAAVRVLWSRDGGLSFEPIMPWSDLTETFTWKAPDVSIDRAMLAVEVKDLAGNIGRRESGLFTMAGTKPLPRPERDFSYSAIAPPVPPAGKVDAQFSQGTIAPTPPAARALARRYYNRGVIYLVRGDYDEAVNELTSALQADPDFISARVDLAVALAQMGRTRDGLEMLETAETACPNEAVFPFNAGLVYYKAGDYKMALAKFQKTVAINPEYIEALWLAADCSIRLQKIPEATRYWLAVVELTRPGNFYHDKARSYLERLGVNTAAVVPRGAGAMIVEPTGTLPKVPQQRMVSEKVVEEASRKPPPAPPNLPKAAEMEASPAARSMAPSARR